MRSGMKSCRASYDLGSAGHMRYVPRSLLPRIAQVRSVVCETKARSLQWGALVALVLVLAPLRLMAATYEGRVGSQAVWLELSQPTDGGRIHGECLYKGTGLAHAVEGDREGVKLRLQTFEESGAQAGVFRLQGDGKRLTGRWTPEGHRSSLPVEVHVGDPRRLREFRDSLLLDAYDHAWMEREFPDLINDSCFEIRHQVLFSRGRLRTVELYSASTGCLTMGYPSEETIVSTYHVETKEVIEVLAEIDSSRRNAFDSLLRPQVQQILEECRSGFPDSEWVAILAPWPLPHPDTNGMPLDPSTSHGLDAIFSLGDWPLPPVDFSLLAEGLVVTFGCDAGGYFGFPHVWRAMEPCGHFTIAYQDLRLFLKPESILRALCEATSPAP